ncbi:MAG TPA: hypothetical protein VEJ46_11115 [Candidatus Acidoferrum sp.]|nr:hypothetical protein [Candidatus Acidoferrum sp.]
MKASKAVLLVLGILLSGAIAVHVQAQNFDKLTKVTFSQPVAIPGKVLPAGTYSFTILDTLGSRNIVQIWNEDKTQLITTVLAIPNYRLETPEQTIIQFAERPANRPQAVKAWFYPGFNYGIEFVYPKPEAVQIAQAANEVVPAETVEPTPSTLKTVPLIAVTPKGEEQSLAKAFPAKPAEQPKAVAKELPKTASQLPLIALFGASCLIVGFGLRRLVTKHL